jgi:hypothetical protein
VNCGAHGVTVGGSVIWGIVVHFVLLLEGANLGEFLCKFFNVGGSNIGGIVVHMVLLWEGAISGGLWCILC